ncbi:MAG: tRNA (N6-isopentenyl adenosine(37)-C2)-methylthiotransferase MiaB [Bdellovibrionota bacterium]
MENTPQNSTENQTVKQPVQAVENGVFISTYGCQMNENDTERMYSLLEMQNYTPVKTPEQANLIIINSCSVREKPVHKVHSEVGSYYKLKNKNPKLKIGVGGCVGQQEKAKLLTRSPLIDFVFGPDNIDELPQILSQGQTTDGKVVKAQFYNNEPYNVEHMVRNPGISTFVNITKGCDNFCTFCVVPFTRGRLRSRPAIDIVNDIKKLTERGVKEVTLLGQNVNSYLGECGTTFAQLLMKLTDETELQRIRYTTSHPKDFNEDLMLVHKNYRDKVCDYIHLPVQSGSTEVLNKMNRVYSREQYLDKVKKILDHVPGVCLSTDIIVGFPGETEQEFQQTLSLLDEVEFETIYAYKYSPRPFTKAARWGDQIPEEVKSERLDRLFKKHKAQLATGCQKAVGQEFDILVEKVNDDYPGIVTGRNSRNQLVHVTNETPIIDKDYIGKTIRVKIEKAKPQTLYATLRGN